MIFYEEYSERLTFYNPPWLVEWSLFVYLFTIAYVTNVLITEFSTKVTIIVIKIMLFIPKLFPILLLLRLSMHEDLKLTFLLSPFSVRLILVLFLFIRILTGLVRSLLIRLWSMWFDFLLSLNKSFIGLTQGIIIRRGFMLCFLLLVLCLRSHVKLFWG